MQIQTLRAMMIGTALAAAGPGARLLAPRIISADRMASCALAMSLPEGQTQ